MWRLNPFSSSSGGGAGKDFAGGSTLEGRTVEIGPVKVAVRSVIAEGGFSTVYSARDVATGKQYALKHMICADDSDALDIATREIRVMSLLKGHPNVITLVAHAVLESGPRGSKEVLLVLEFCHKSLAFVLLDTDNAIEENQILLVARDVCNALFAMHKQSPPIAHRDLKPENVLLGSDGVWKLCDFGSTSTRHKVFDTPEEMGVEEDNIRRYTTPAYRAPEMWDLYRREVISEKVDIWALGCLIYRLCYLKLAFDGESKLQILNGNYRIPDLPKYSSSMTRLIKEMLENSPNDRPDIMQVWFRLNEQLPVELRKKMPENAPLAAASSQSQSTNLHEEERRRTSPMPCRSSPASLRETSHNSVSPPSVDIPQPGIVGAATGSFWSMQHAQDSQVIRNNPPLFDEEPPQSLRTKYSPTRVDNEGSTVIRTDRSGNTAENGVNTVLNRSYQKSTKAQQESRPSFSDDAFNMFVAEFDPSKLQSGGSMGIVSPASNGSRRKELQTEIACLAEQLKKTILEKDELKSKYDKLSTICRAQRQELQELKLSAADEAPPLRTKVGLRSQISEENIQGISRSNFSAANTEPKQWQAFSEAQTHSAPSNADKNSRGSLNVQQGFTRSTQTEPSFDTWAFDFGNLKQSPTSRGGVALSSYPPAGDNSSLHGHSRTTKAEKPSGWTGF